MDYQVGFVLLQIIFTFTIGWFIRLLMQFSKDIKLLDERVDNVENDLNVYRAVRKEKEIAIQVSLDRIESMIKEITTIHVVDGGGRK